MARNRSTDLYCLGVLLPSVPFCSPLKTNGRALYLSSQQLAPKFVHSCGYRGSATQPCELRHAHRSTRKQGCCFLHVAVGNSSGLGVIQARSLENIFNFVFGREHAVQHERCQRRVVAWPYYDTVIYMVRRAPHSSWTPDNKGARASIKYHKRHPSGNDRLPYLPLYNVEQCTACMWHIVTRGYRHSGIRSTAVKLQYFQKRSSHKRYSLTPWQSPRTRYDTPT